MKEKACPIVVRQRAGSRQVLLFKHPAAGTQLVKGGINPGETPIAAAHRELFEESGLSAETIRPLTVYDHENLGERWHVFLCSVSPTAESWTHQTTDDHGHAFAFFWHDVRAAPPTGMDARYIAVLDVVFAEHVSR